METLLKTQILKPFGVFLDWLSLNMRGPLSVGDITEPRPWIGERWLVPVPDERRALSAVFQKEYQLFDRAGEKCCTIWCRPYGTHLGPRNWYQVQFANASLYDGTWKEILDTLKAMGFAHHGITRIDFAADGLVSECDYLGLMHRAFHGGVDYYGRALWRPVIHRKRLRNAELGTRNGNKFLRCYDKTEEIKDPAKDKPHIRDAWESILGTPPEMLNEAVQRLEVQMKGTELRRYYPQERSLSWVASLVEPEARMEAFAATVPSMFDWRYPAARARDAVPAVEWDWTNCTSRPAFDVPEREPRTITLGVNTLKSNIRTLYLIYLATSDTSFLQQVRTLVAARDLERWFAKSERRWRDEFLLLSGARTTKDGRTADKGTLDLFRRLKL